ncbi:MAG: preprotein translocase subunit SecE [Robiginitomaculum sp.]|nr:preprotein translocase subunit SecE [Robiginitomaculum sp.]
MAEKSKQKVGPVKYLEQVQQEGRKVVWPSARETMTTSIMVIIVMIFLGVFFWVVDFFAGNTVVCVAEIGQAADVAKKCILGLSSGS